MIISSVNILYTYIIYWLVKTYNKENCFIVIQSVIYYYSERKFVSEVVFTLASFDLCLCHIAASLTIF